MRVRQLYLFKFHTLKVKFTAKCHMNRSICKQHRHSVRAYFMYNFHVIPINPNNKNIDKSNTVCFFFIG